MGWVRQCWKPIVLLLVLSPLLAEGVSGATPLTLLFMPWILFPYATILYGFLVLVIREVAVRRRLGVLGLWCLGIVYGLYNEGLRAETLFFPLDNPLDSFFDYGLVAGVRVPFAVWIGFWHGLFSVVAPVFFVEYLFPRQANRPWLPRPATWLLAILTVGTAVPYFLFLSESSHTPDTASLIVRLAVMVGSGLVLWFVAGWLPRTPGITAQSGYCGFSWKPFSWGAGLYLFLFVVPEVLAQGGAAWPLFVLYVVAFATASGWAIARRTETSRKEAVVFLLGAVTAQATLSVLFGVLSGNLLSAASGATFTAAFVVSLVRIRRGPAAVTDCPHP